MTVTEIEIDLEYHPFFRDMKSEHLATETLHGARSGNFVASNASRRKLLPHWGQDVCFLCPLINSHLQPLPNPGACCCHKDSTHETNRIYKIT